MPDKHFSVLKNSGVYLLFQQAEDAIEETEVTRNELIIPAVNELRYAGYHITNFINDPSKTNEIKLAEGHCKRAIYDAYEASILYLISQFNKFKDDYRTVVISSVVPNIAEYNIKLDDVVKFVTTIDKETKVEHYQRCSNFYTQLSTIIKELDSSRDDLNILFAKERNSSIMLVLAFLGVLLAAIALVTSR